MHQGRPTSIIQNNSNFISLVLKPIHRLTLPSWEQLSNLLSCGVHPWNLLLLFFHVPLLVIIEASICILLIAWKGSFKHLSSQVKVCLCLDANVTACWFLLSCSWIFLFILIKGKKPSQPLFISSRTVLNTTCSSSGTSSANPQSIGQERKKCLLFVYSKC